jgi:hypothetical protein
MMNEEKRLEAQKDWLVSSKLNMSYATGGAACFIIGGLVLAILMHYVVDGADGFLARLPWITMFLGVLSALSWFIHLIRADQAHTRAIEAERAAALSQSIRVEAKAKLVYAQSQLENAKPKPITINQAAPPQLHDSQLRTEDISDGRGGYFSITLSRMRRLIENYPTTSRADLIAKCVVPGAADHSQLIKAGEYYGWLGKPRDNGTNGQGIGAQWIIPVEQARQMLAGMYTAAEQRARAGAQSPQAFIAPSAPPQAVEVYQGNQHVY